MINNKIVNYKFNYLTHIYGEFNVNSLIENASKLNEFNNTNSLL